MLDTLKKHNAPGAFFVLDNLIRRNTGLVRRMAEEGHLICNHTVRHRDMSGFSREEFEKELHALEDVLREYTGLEMAKYYRPPEGRFSEENLKYAQDMGYKTVFWSLAYADWDNAKQPAPDKAMALLDANIHNGAIVLLHPTSKTNADILDTLMTKWEKDGYRFASLDELLQMKGCRFVISLLCLSMMLCTCTFAERDSRVIFSGSGGEKKIALTFDDGPHRTKTAQILALLEEYNVKATFSSSAAMPKAIPISSAPR